MGDSIVRVTDRSCRGKRSHGGRPTNHHNWLRNSNNKAYKNRIKREERALNMLKEIRQMMGRE